MLDSYMQYTQDKFYEPRGLCWNFGIAYLINAISLMKPKEKIKMG